MDKSKKKKNISINRGIFRKSSNYWIRKLIKEQPEDLFPEIILNGRHQKQNKHKTDDIVYKAIVDSVIKQTRIEL